MKQFIKQIEESYLARSDNPDLQKSTWQELTAQLPPHLAPEQRERPSLLLARDAGDLGLALLWIVQATLVRSQAHSLLRQLDNNPAMKTVLENIAPDVIGAMAHTEDRNNPLIVREEGDTIILNGVKKYITGGKTADFILATAKLTAEEKMSQLIYIPVAELPDTALEELPLPSLKTTSHATLTLENTRLPKTNNLGPEGSSLRRSLKKWSILERSLILEAVIAFLIYLNRRLDSILDENHLEELRETQSGIIKDQVESALDNSHIDEKTVDLPSLLKHIDTLKEAAARSEEAVPEELNRRLTDLNFMKAIAGAR
ncbi:MAG: hypothetical protein GY754_09610 [bacterium]|nr:hypothetical protein [bacterium]